VGKVIVVAASNKIGVVSNFKTTSLDRIDVLVTDRKGGLLIEQMETPEGLTIVIADIQE